MARGQVTVQDIVATAAGLEPTYEAADSVNGHQFPNTGKHFLQIKNGSGVTAIGTLTTPFTKEGLPLADLPCTVEAGEDVMFGPFDPGTYNQPSGTDAGQIFLDFDVDTTITFAVIKLP